MMIADTMEALGIERGNYIVRINSRKVLDAVMIALGIVDASAKLTVLRAIDKLDKLGIEGVKELLGKGRKDESGDFTEGANLGKIQIDLIAKLVDVKNFEITRSEFVKHLDFLFASSPEVHSAGAEIGDVINFVQGCGYGIDRITADPSIVRGLEYYTGLVFECELLIPTMDDTGRTVRFGAVGGGGRYDDLVARFTGAQVPATGFSIGVSRLYSALKLVGKAQTADTLAPVVVLVMDKDRQGDYWRMVQHLRAANIRAEMYVGTAGMKAQMKYADKRGAPLVVIQGGDEKANAQVQVKDLRLGSQLAASIESREEYASQRLAQVTVAESELVATVQKMLVQ